MTLDELNQLPSEDVAKVFESCCVAQRWINGMVNARPFHSLDQLLNCADRLWQQASENDIREAFEGHPRIGDVNTLKAKFANTAQTAGHEQSGMSLADEAVLQAMKTLNDEYYERFGYIFIVFASGKSAREMLGILKSRLRNDADTELKIAAAEQGKITRLRLRKLLGAEYD